MGIVRESVNFERGSDPKSAMGLGHFRYSDGRSIEIGDDVEVEVGEEEEDFWGYVVSFHGEYVTVRDQYDNAYDVEAHKLILDESVNFERGLDPKRALKIGRTAIWRKEYDGKPFIRITFFLKDPMGNKKRYVANLMYGANYDGDPDDSVWWDRARLISAWQGGGGTLAVRNMQNKPVNFLEGDPDERMMWKVPEAFNKEVIYPLLDEHPKAVIDKIVEEWWEDDFEDLMTGWFDTGVMKVFNIKYEAL